jgi:uncharacterized protein YecE (DUF72 family)
MSEVRIGTSGYVYAHWKGLLYPPLLPPGRWLSLYAQLFRTLELNTTFYRLPPPGASARWHDATPGDFVFAAKGSRFLTHMKRLLDVSGGPARFFERLAGLGAKLGVVLWQLPPKMRPDHGRLDAFLERQPRAVRHAVEFRDERWYSEDVCRVLDRHGAAFCEHDHLLRPPPRLTGGFRYVRFHGATAPGGRYGRGGLRGAATELARWRDAGGDAYVYFNNDAGGHAITDAIALMRLLDQPSRSPERWPESPV